MYLHEPIYDLELLAEQNLHLHTVFSGCAKPEMTIENILDTVRETDLKTIALTDHFNDNITSEDYLEHIRFLRAAIAKEALDFKVLIGAELSAYAPGKSLENDAVRDALDYRLFSCNHYHLDYWGQPENKTLRGYAEYSAATLRSLIVSGKADCIAHPFIGRFVDAFDDKTLVTKEMSDLELGTLLELSNTHEVAWELNTGAILGDPDFGRRLWNLGREVGVVFNYGTDGHRLTDIDTQRLLPEVKKVLL